MVRFDETTRTIIDGRTAGFCKLIADRATCAILGCHVVGERAVEIVQAVAIAAGMRVDDLTHILSCWAAWYACGTNIRRPVMSPAA